MHELYVFRNEDSWALQNLHAKNGMFAAAWEEFISGLSTVFNFAFDGKIEIVFHGLEELTAQVKAAVGNAKTISIDPCIEGDLNVGTSRIFLPGGKDEVGIGGRPGFPEIDEQIAKIPAGEYVLIEDDIFSGGTIISMIDLFSSNGILISKIVCGIQVGNTAIKIPVCAIEKYQSVIDLNDPRDFLAGAHGGGLVIKHPSGKLIRCPYVLPFVDSTARSSIPADKVLMFSKKIWELNVVFWRNFPEIKLFNVEKYFFEALELEGFSGQESMENVCMEILCRLP